MPSAAKEKMFHLPIRWSGESVFPLAAALTVLETHNTENAARGKKSHQGDFSNKRTIAVGPTWVKWQKTHRDSGPLWPETAVGSGDTFKYDPFGRRIQKSTSSGTVNYLYDGAFDRLLKNNGWNVIEEVDNSGNVLARYTQGQVMDQTFAEL